MKKVSESTSATVKDYSEGKDGSKEVTVDYSFEYNQIETKEDLDSEFSLSDLIKLGTNKNKATANSNARQKAIAPYAQDPNSPEAVKKGILAGLLKLGIPEEVAKGMVESASAQATK